MGVEAYPENVGYPRITYTRALSEPNVYGGLPVDFQRRYTTFSQSASDLSSVNSEPAQVVVYAFRGLRHVNGVRVRDLSKEERQKITAVQEEFPLLYTGHVAVSIDGGKTIYGFGPVVPEGKSLLIDIVPLLKKHESYTGQVTDDTRTFKEAERRHLEHGWNTRVYKCIVPVTRAKYEKVKQRLHYFLSASGGEHGYRYTFPLKVSADPEGQRYFHEKYIANCATFPKDALGLDIATWRGSLVRFMRDLVQKAHIKTLATLPLADTSASDVDSDTSDSRSRASSVATAHAPVTTSVSRACDDLVKCAKGDQGYVLLRPQVSADNATTSQSVIGGTRNMCSTASVSRQCDHLPRRT